MKKREIIILSTLSFSLGLVIGFLTSPIKEGITIIGGNTTNYSKKKDDETEE